MALAIKFHLKFSYWKNISKDLLENLDILQKTNKFRLKI